MIILQNCMRDHGEVFRRTLRLTPYRVQVMAAIALNQRHVVEMQTGEGKTLVAVFTACLNALTGKGVTFSPLTITSPGAMRTGCVLYIEFLGFSVGYIQEGMPAAERKQLTAATSRMLPRRK